MTLPVDLGKLRTGEWERLQEIADRFEQAWLQQSDGSGTVDLSQFLPPPGDQLRSAALVELVSTDLEIRWRRGQVISIDTYLERFPELGPGREMPAKLVYEEFRVRHLYGDKPNLEKYRTRFPAQFAELEQMVRESPVETLTLTAEKTPSKHDTPVAPVHTTPAPSKAPSTNRPGSAMVSANNFLQQHGADYALVKRIGSGSYGEVWKAEAPGGIEVAVKLITRPIEQAEAQHEKLALELMKNVRHPFLVQTHTYWIFEDRLFIVMELADGSLRERLRECLKAGERGVPLRELIGYMRESAEALDFLHAENIHHRDIKPENILVLKRHAKVADFGLARWLECQRSLINATTTGTPAYMAPEVWGGTISPHSDQYSLAVTYFELRSGRRLFESRAMIDLMRSHTTESPDLNPLEPEEQNVLLKALSKNPDERYPCCFDFVRALEDATTPKPPPPPPSAVVVEVAPEPPKRSRLRYAWVALAALPFLVYWAASPRHPGTVSLEVASSLLRAGQEQTVTVSVRRDHLADRIYLHFEGVPAGIRLDDAVVPEGVDRVEVPVGVAAEHPPGLSRINVRADNGDPNVPLAQSVFELDVLPPGFEPTGDEVTADINGRKFHARIARVWPDGTRADFILIPRTRSSLRPGKADLDTYYIMENKVSLELFRKFCGEHPDLVKDRGWDKPRPNEQVPVLGVRVTDAYRFATTWFRGNLPTTDQWDKAAGYYAEPPGEGPYRGKWGRDGKLGIAVERTAPMKIGEAKDDVSPHGCRDMSGNGQEWTRSLMEGTLPVIPEPSANDLVLVQLRGRQHTAPDPFRFEFLNGFTNPNREAFDYQGTNPQLGFRVVIEP